MRLLLISSSNVHGYGYLDHAEPELRRVLQGVSTVSFVPFAQQDHEQYTATVRARLAAMELDVAQVRTLADVEQAEAIFIGGGNSFRLLNTLYERDVLNAIRDRVKDAPYIGSSAGTNVATPSIRTTNDMPILYPPSFDALGLVSFQINPHYLDASPDFTHKGETREDRIREFHEENATPVIGLREGSMLDVQDGIVTLIGLRSARIFRQGETPYELEPGSRLEL
ncbi:MAG TPA: dipeptidase PepE [Thermoanaerobaculia bacterium]|jgi:dipeptidase E|nr:dipeptidase PepE [Thermoanaerobaculia bacterium]